MVEIHKRLPRNFHYTFKPERQYINALLRYTASGRSGSLVEIAKETGIPMGRFSGKVPAILDYCRGMGLITLSNKTKKTAVKKPLLTEFGRMVLLEDPYLKCVITQWIAHFNLCDSYHGADVWFYTFSPGYYSLGDSFSRTDLENFLCLQLGTKECNIIGPMLGMYEDESSFVNCSAISEVDGVISRKIAPDKNEYGRGYGAWLLQLMKDYFPNQQQISIVELEELAGWKSIPGWSNSNAIRILDLIEKKGMLRVDRLMNPWLIQATISPERAWRTIYDDVL